MHHQSLVIFLLVGSAAGFTSRALSWQRRHQRHVATTTTTGTSTRTRQTSCRRQMTADLGGWQGDVVSNQGGVIRGCSIKAVGEEPTTQWELSIDG